MWRSAFPNTNLNTLKIQDGGFYSKKLGELSLMDSDKTGREEHAYIGHRKWHFFGNNVDFLATGGRLNGISDLKLMYEEKEFGIYCTPSPYDSFNRESKMFRF